MTKVITAPVGQSTKIIVRISRKGKMHEIYYTRIGHIEEVSDNVAEQLKKFYKMFKHNGTWRNERGDVWLWERAENGNDKRD